VFNPVFGQFPKKLRVHLTVLRGTVPGGIGTSGLRILELENQVQPVTELVSGAGACLAYVGNEFGQSLRFRR
jgi:hypothetical protein